MSSDNFEFFFSDQPSINDEASAVRTAQRLHLQTNSLPNVSQDFRNFLANIHEPPAFNFDQFKTCSDKAVKGCAEVLVEQSVKKSQDVAAFAQIAWSVHSGVHSGAQFSFHLSDSLEKKLATRPGKDWRRLASLGLLIGHLYVNECIGVKSYWKIILMKCAVD